MSKITSFNRQNLKELSKDMTDAMQAVAEKYGFFLELSNGRFDADTYSKKFTMRIINQTPSATISNATIANPTLGIPNIYDRSLIGKKFRFQGNEYEIVNLMPSRPKYPIVGQSIRGARYKFTTEVLKNLVS